MVGYVTVGTNDFQRALAFYDALFAEVGVQRLWSHGGMAAWGRSREAVAFCVAEPHNGQAASVGNGCMVALRMSDRGQVQVLHAKALELGGLDEGLPGPRGTHGFYGAYFRDLDGNKINAHVPAS
ncbi:MAG: VOC family protein [Proteobacteria bacterium]|nr:VOC family protein [Pseudomonadota bacterium]